MGITVAWCGNIDGMDGDVTVITPIVVVGNSDVSW